MWSDLITIYNDIYLKLPFLLSKFLPVYIKNRTLSCYLLMIIDCKRVSLALYVNDEVYTFILHLILNNNTSLSSDFLIIAAFLNYQIYIPHAYT